MTRVSLEPTYTKQRGGRSLNHRDSGLVQRKVDVLNDAKLSVMTENIASLVLYKYTASCAKLNSFIVLVEFSEA